MKKLILLLLLFPFAVSAQKNFTTQFDNYMNAQVSVNDFSGTVLVARKGKVIYEKAFGLADRELNVKNNLQSKYQIGSITKQFTACGILLLAEEGKLTLNDKLNKYFPDFPKSDSVTIHMLLNHTSGIKDYTDLAGFWKMAALPIEKDSMLALIEKQPYDFSPGTQWKYNNSGYFLLGYIIEKVTAKSYSDYILKDIIKKAGLENTFVNRWDTILINRAKDYEKKPVGWQNSAYISMEGPYSAGAIISTAEDLYKWNNVLFSNKIISAASFKKMTTAYLGNYGYGLFIDTFQHYVRIGHGGGIQGFTSYLCRFSADSVIIVVLSNNGIEVDGVANALAAIVFGIPVLAPFKYREFKIDSNLTDKYIGKYLIPSLGEIEIIKKNGKLYRHIVDSEIELKPASDTLFFYGDGSDRRIEFKVNKSGKVINVFFILTGIKEEMKRL